LSTRTPAATELAWTSAEQPRAVRLLRLAALSVSALNSHDVVTGPFLLGLALILLATLVTCTPAFSSYASWAMMTIPLIDLGAICAFHLVPEVDVVGALVAVPALWLGGIYRWRGVAIVSVFSTVIFTIPKLLNIGTSEGGWPRAAAIVLFAVIASTAMATIVELWIRQVVRLQEQGVQLSEALEVAEGHRQHIETIVQTVDVGMAALGPDGSYISMNPRHQELMRLVFPDGHRGVAGQDGYVFAADNSTKLEHDQMPSVRAQRGETFSDSQMWIGKEPSTRLAISASARPMLDENGSFAGAVLAYHDITDLMRALRVKDDFVASVSHELRTPLTSIMGYLDLASEQNDQLPDEVVHYLGVASRNADRLLLLVSDLLTAAQGDSAAMLLFPESTDLSALVRLGLDDVAHRAQLAGLALRSDIEPQLLVMVDQGRIEQVVENLLSNAMKYTRPGGTISLSLEREGSNVVLAVSDTGIGISAEDQERLFTKFFRANSATESAIPGIGLGLVISKTIIDAHGGTITLESREGVGTSVRVSLPFVPARSLAGADELTFTGD
jgi:two-component system, OmpR family, phosphate regulon sensor histidine kinase PhoR